jgi:short-subunit dehydrogenase
MTQNNSQMEKYICLITGASAGIGRAIAIQYAEMGWDLILTARRTKPMIELAEELERKHGTISHIFKVDFFEKNATQKLLKKIKAKGLKVSGLVNNAGYGHPGVFLDSDWKDHEKFIQLMMTAPCELVRALAPEMVDNKFGRIINVASLAGHLPGSKGHTLYAGVKSFLVKFSESLNAEFYGSGVNVSALCPGFTLTEFHDVNGTREGINKLPSFMLMDADTCARLGVRACENNHAVYVSGKVNKFISVLGRILPNKLAQKLMSKNSQRYRKIN